MNDRNINVATITGITLMLVAMVVLVITIMGQLSKLEDERKSVNHTNRTLATLSTVLESLEDAETGQRGFLITGREEYLAPYQTAEVRVSAAVPELAQLTKDNPENKKNIVALENAITTKFAELKRTITLRRQKGFEEARQVVLTDLGKHEMDQIRTIVTQMRDNENQLLIRHHNAQDRQAKYAFLGLFLICSAAIIFQIIMGFIIINFLKIRKQAEDALRKAMNTLKEQADLLELSSDAILVRDFDGTIQYWNRGAELIYGYSKQQALGTKSHDLFRTEFPKPLSEIEEDILTKGRWIGELVHYSPDNQRIIVYSRHILRKDVDGKSTGVLEINTDITERKEMERRVSEFYSTVSHELRTPLTSIRGSLSLMEGGRLGPLPPRVQHLTEIARSESERLIRLINDILDIRKIEADKLQLAFEELLPSEIVDITLQSMESMAAQSSIKFISQIRTTEKIYCDRDRISQVLTNLISNAIKFSSPGADIAVQVESASPDSIRFSVLDKGVGIAEEQLPKLFGLFQQLDSTDSRPKGGTGLGLAISKAIVEQHGGKIGVNSTLGEGSTFWFELPVKQHIETISPENVPAKYKVLLVEDDHHLCLVLSEALASERYGVNEVPTLKKATEYLDTQEPPDVILLDLNLPDGNGFELLQQMRKHPRTSSIPVVIITGSEHSAGVYPDPLLIDWIKKPFDVQRLLCALRLAISSSRVPGRARVLVVDDDAATRELIKQQLQSFDIECLEASDGIDAIHLARANNPDLIILDLSMPQPDGFEVVEILRQEKNQTTPLLIYTARDLTGEDKEKLKLGLSAYLTKSRTSEEQFLNTVKNLLNGLLVNHKKENDKTPSPPSTS